MQKTKFKQTEIGMIPEDWEITTLENISLVVTDGSHFSPKKDRRGNKIIATVKNMRYNGFDFLECKRISDSDFEALVKNGCSPEKGDILISKDGANCLDIIFVYNQEEKIVILSSIAIVRLKDLYNPLFYRYFLLSPSAQKIMREGYVSGSAIPRVILKDFKKVPVPKVPRIMQDFIAETLSDLDSKIELNQQMNKTLEAISQAIFKHWFVDFEFPNEKGKPYKSSGEEIVDSELGKIPKGWKVKRLGDVLSELDSGNRPQGGVSGFSEGIPSVGAENIFGIGNYDYSSTKYVPFDFFNQMNSGIIKNGDVLLYKDGAQLGRKSIFMENFPFAKCCVNEHVFILRVKDEITPIYLYFWLDQQWMTEEIKNLNTNSAQPGINKTAVKTLKILIPDTETMKNFELLFPLIKRLFKNSLENRQLSNVRDILLPKLMSGKIRVPVEVRA